MGLAPTDAKKARMNQAQKMLETLLPLKYRKAISILVLNLGLSNRNARDYIENLIEYNNWDIKDGIIQKSVAV